MGAWRTGVRMQIDAGRRVEYFTGILMGGFEIFTKRREKARFEIAGWLLRSRCP